MNMFRSAVFLKQNNVILFSTVIYFLPIFENVDSVPQNRNLCATKFQPSITMNVTYLVCKINV